MTRNTRGVFKLGLMTGAFALGLLAVSPAPAKAGHEILKSADAEALELRVLQTELMVGALTCEAKGDYNAFVQKYQSELVAGGQKLRRLFQRAHGGRGQAKLTTFVTRLANERSMNSLKDVAGFCERIEYTFDNLLQGDATALAQQRSNYGCGMTGGRVSCGEVAATLTASGK